MYLFIINVLIFNQFSTNGFKYYFGQSLESPLVALVFKKTSSIMPGISPIIQIWCYAKA